MSTSSLLVIVGTVLGLVLGGLVVLGVALFAIGKLGDAIAGLPAVRASLLARGIDRRLADRMMIEIEATNGGIGVAIFVLLLGAAALAFGLYGLGEMYAPEVEELALYPAPGIGLLAAGVWIFARSRRVDPDRSATHRALVTRAAHVTALVPTMIRLNLNITTAADALAATRVTQWTPVPHVIVLFDDGTEHPVRAFHDDDTLAHELVRCLAAMLPRARVEGFVPAWGGTESGGARAMA